MIKHDPTPVLNFLMRIAVEFETPFVVSGGPLGTRRFLCAKNGQFEGSGLRGQVQPGGGDWVLVRRDQSAQLDIRFALRTEEGELVLMQGAGLFSASESVALRIRRGEDVGPENYYFRTSILFETGSERLSHLNSALHIGVGQRTPSGMTTDVFVVC